MKSLFFILLCTVASAEVVDRIIAVVNNEVILESDLSRLENKVGKPALIEDALLQGRDANDLKKNRSFKIDYLINERLLDSEVKRLNLTASSERVEQELKQMASRYKTTPQDILTAAKADTGLNADEYRKFLKTQIERQGLIETEVSSKIRVSDEEVYAEYRKRNPKTKSLLTEVTLAHIFFNPKKGGPDKAKARAQSTLEKLKSGQKFDSVAEQNSEDPDFNNGGLLGTFGAGELIPEFEKGLDGLKKGDYTQVVQSKRGFHILKILDEKVGKDSEFDKEKEKLRTSLMEKSFEKQFSTWLKRKKEDATINNFERK